MVTTAELAATVMARADRLGSISEDAGRLVRRPLTGPARDAEDLVASWLTEAGATVTRDAVGNVFGRLENAGDGGPALVGPVETTLSRSGILARAGLYDDPFFFDLQGFRETRSTGTLSFQANRSFFTGQNDTALVVQILLAI